MDVGEPFGGAEFAGQRESVGPVEFFPVLSDVGFACGSEKGRRNWLLPSQVTPMGNPEKMVVRTSSGEFTVTR